MAVLAVAGLALSACGSDNDSTNASSGPSSSVHRPATTASSATTSPAAEVLAGAATTPTSTPPQNGPKAFLTAVRADSHPGYDRVVFEFEGPTPGYSAAYLTEPLRNEDSGAAIPIDGAAVVKLVFASAGSADLGVDGVRETYTGPKRFTPSGTPVVAELVQVSDFEGYVTWAVGLRREAPFKVQLLPSPSRVVIDFQS